MQLYSECGDVNPRSRYRAAFGARHANLCRDSDIHGLSTLLISEPRHKNCLFLSLKCPDPGSGWKMQAMAWRRRKSQKPCTENSKFCVVVLTFAVYGVARAGQVTGALHGGDEPGGSVPLYVLPTSVSTVHATPAIHTPYFCLVKSVTRSVQ